MQLEFNIIKQKTNREEYLLFFLQNRARYFQQQDNVHSLFSLCYAHQVSWQYLYIFYLFQNCLRYFQQQDEVKFCLFFVMLTLLKLCKIFSILNNSMRCILCLLFVMLTRWVGNICTAPQRITNRGRLLSTQGAKWILPKCNNKRKNRQRVSLRLLLTEIKRQNRGRCF